MTLSRPLSSGLPLPPRPAPAPIAPDAVSVLGIPLAMTDYAATMEWIDATIAHREKGYICVAATHTVMVCDEDPELREAVLNSSLTLPDGQPLVWAMNALGGDLDERVYGPELMARYCERAAGTGIRMYLYGGRNQGALVQLALNLRQRYPGVKIVGGYSPPFRDLSEEEEDAIVTEMNGSKADVIWVGVGAPKQEKWMAAMRERLDAPVLVGVGAAFDFHAGLVPQAPEWMQSAGLEWLFRMAQEPRRLAPRYVRYNPRFITGFARQYARHRLMGDARER
ncbi:MAG TPA: WecB/TagA/CpsF family glycosyltransferase [Thermoleophilaceae bacterium]|nr:WecB/TagA/CpsF family glycosyltransferase [Thermoleophilaceae bacterium]